MTGCATGRSRDRLPDRNRSRSCQSRKILDGNRTGSCQSHPPGVKSPVVTGPWNTSYQGKVSFPLRLADERVIDSIVLQGTPTQVDISKRPKEVAWWINRGRRFDRYPSIDDVSEYADSWKVWYTAQFQGHRGEKWPLSTSSDGVDEKKMLEKIGSIGPNGIRMFLFSLSWMLPEPGDTTPPNSNPPPNVLEAFSSAVRDLHHVFDRLLIRQLSSKKRPAEDQSASNQPTKKPKRSRRG